MPLCKLYTSAECTDTDCKQNGITKIIYVDITKNYQNLDAVPTMRIYMSDIILVLSIKKKNNICTQLTSGKILI
jgi:hypothetical protein